MSEYELLPGIARRSAREFGSHVALCRSQAMGGGSLTYAELWSHVETGARNLRAAGLSSGDPVILMLAPQPAWAPSLFSILEAGLVVVPLVAGLDPARVAGAAAFVGAKAIVADPPFPPGTLPRISPTKLFTSSEHAHTWTRPTRSATAMIVFTSGSTSSPRAVELTHGNLLANLESLLELRRARPGDSFLSMLPPSHLFEFMGGTLAPLACGARVVFPGPLLPNRLVAALRDEKITHALAVPALLDALYREVRSAIDAAGILDPAPAGAGIAHSAQWFREAESARRDAVRAAVRDAIGPSFAKFIVGGAALHPEWVQVLTSVDVRLDTGYGLTEASPIVTMGAAGECPPGSVGRALPGVEIRIGDAGEILVRGANVMRGYFRDPAATRAAIVDGWLHTGDIGRIDADGFVHVDGRIKEAIVTAAGVTVYPEEVEPFYASPLFGEMAVCPCPGDDGNDVATLVVHPARTPVALADLEHEFARLRAAAPPRLRVSRMRVVTLPFPRTATGKVRRRVLGASLGTDASTDGTIR